ncbi:lysostaphin resistance A-like protein [Weissella minor]|uniref:CPBP family intramembrane glutamic endopeptidase n=1 Tax=Weissella minor TaxID=1620 RepID=UPI003AF1FFB5
MKKVISALLFPFLVVLIQIVTLGELIWPNENVASVNVGKHFLVAFVSFFVLLFVLMFMYRKLDGQSFDLKHWSIRNLVIAVLAAVLSQVVQGIISAWAHQGTSDPRTYQALHSNIWLITVITMVVLSPILEEILFQGILQDGILKNVHPSISIPLTAMIFAIIHGFGFHLGTIELLVTGLTFACVFWYTKDLKMAMICHGLANLIVLILLLI